MSLKFLDYSGLQRVIAKIKALIPTRVSQLTNDSAFGVGNITNVKAGTGLTGGGTSGEVTLNVSYGTSSTTACVGNDSRLSNSRTPTSHASTSTTYGVGTTANYGHVKTINNLTSSSYVNGNALSAYQGYLLNQSKAPKMTSSSINLYVSADAKDGTSTSWSVMNKGTAQSISIPSINRYYLIRAVCTSFTNSKNSYEPWLCSVMLLFDRTNLKLYYLGCDNGDISTLITYSKSSPISSSNPMMIPVAFNNTIDSGPSSPTGDMRIILAMTTQSSDNFTFQLGTFNKGSLNNYTLTSSVTVEVTNL